MRKHRIVVAKMGNSYAAKCPDLPGCAALGSSRKGAEKNLREAITLRMRYFQNERLVLHGR